MCTLSSFLTLTSAWFYTVSLTHFHCFPTVELSVRINARSYSNLVIELPPIFYLSMAGNVCNSMLLIMKFCVLPSDFQHLPSIFSMNQK